jgi:hypothetical protein
VKRLSDWIVCLALFSALQGCVSMGSSLPTDEPYAKNDSEALVLIGTVSEADRIVIDAGKPFVIREITLRDLKKGTDVFAIRADVGSEFGVYKVYAKGSYVFHNRRTIKIEKPGIYYYGTLLTRAGAALNYKPNPEAIVLARNKYKNAFDQLQPVNFK